MPVLSLLAAVMVASSIVGTPMSAHVARAATVGDDSLRAAIARRIAAVPGAEVGLAFRDLGDEADTLRLGSDVPFHAASTMKVPVMIQLFRDADAGRLRMDQRLLLVNRFASIVDGSPYELDAHDDSDSLVYRWVGQRVAVRELLQHMITRSSNLATNELIDVVGAARADSTAHALGATGMRVLRGVEDDKAYRAGRNNTTTARALEVLLTAIERGTAAAPRSCSAMRDILLAQEFSAEIPAGLPPGTRVAHKTGWITGHLHDAAIVYPEGRPPYVLVVLTRGIPDETVARALIADLSRLVYAHVSGRGGAAVAGS